MTPRVLTALPFEQGPYRISPDPAPRIGHCRLTVDLEAGTAEWVPDKPGKGPVQLTIGDGPGQLASLKRVLYPPAFPNDGRGVFGGKLLLLDARGVVIAKTSGVVQHVFDQAWPIDRLRATGLPVAEQRYRNTRVLHQAHPGATPMWPMTAGYLWSLLTMSLVLLIVAGWVAIFVTLTGG